MHTRSVSRLGLLVCIIICICHYPRCRLGQSIGRYIPVHCTVTTYRIISRDFVFLLTIAPLQMASSSITFSPCHQSHHPHTLSSSTSSRSSPPPMFTVVVDGTRADRSAVTCVSFVGSVEPVTVKVTLPLNDSETETQLL